MTEKKISEEQFFDVPETGETLTSEVSTSDSDVIEKDFSDRSIVEKVHIPEKTDKFAGQLSSTASSSLLKKGKDNRETSSGISVGKARSKQTLLTSSSGSQALATPVSRFTGASISERFYVMIQNLGIKPSLEYPTIIGITSSVRGEGRTTIALGLANAIAQQTPLPVILVEADITLPALATDLNLTNLGLSEYLRGELPLHTESLNELSILLAGDTKGDTLKTLRTTRLEELFEDLVNRYAVIIVDLPPLAMTAETARLLDQVDRVLMVVKAGATPTRTVQTAFNLIPEEKRTGVVLNRTRPAFRPFGWLGKLFQRSGV